MRRCQRHPIVRTSEAAPTDDKLSIILAYLVSAPPPAARVHQDIEHEHRRAVFQPKLDDAEVQNAPRGAATNSVFVVNAAKGCLLVAGLNVAGLSREACASLQQATL